MTNAPPAPPDRQPDSPQERPRLLVVDDQPINIQTLYQIFQADHEVFMATSGQQALDFCQNNIAPDLILLDVVMPGMDGHETCRRLKSNPALSSIPVVFVTTLSETKAEVAGLSLGAADYITKPVNVDIARQRVHNLLERERLRKEVEEQRNLLEQRVAERTRELEIAKVAAETANRAKSIFLANMSHELRTPLNAILGFAQLMARDARIPEDRRANLATINKSGQHLLSLINDVLEISRIEAGHLTRQIGAVDLPGLLTTLSEAMLARAREKGLQLHLDMASSLPRYIETDTVKLRQILHNLLANALKFTPQGEIALSAHPLPSPDDRLMVEFVVRDSGVGIAPDDHGRIFMPFFQTEAGVSLGEGTGLGLPISQEYARLLGGELTVDSRLGEGSTFRLRIPVEITEAPAALAPLAHVRHLSAGQDEFRILVAEDEPVNQELLKTWLEEVGFAVRVASNGREAVILCEQWHPHFVWLDMRMPVMDGYAAARAIRQLPAGKDIPIIAFTASIFEEERQAILEAGCNDIALKPFDENRVFGLMAQYLPVRYDCDEPVGESSGAIDWRILPAELRERLKQAALALDVEETRELAQQLEKDQPVIAKHLLELLDLYRFDKIAMELDSGGQ